MASNRVDLKYINWNTTTIYNVCAKIYIRGAIKIEQSRETGNTGHTRQRKTKQKHNTIRVGHHYTQTKTNNVK